MLGNLREKISETKERIKDSFNGDVVVAKEFRKNFKQLMKDFEDGKIFKDEKAKDNAKSTFGDLARITSMSALFVLPGGSVGIIALKKLLESDFAKSHGIKNYLELSISMRVSPLIKLPDIPLGPIHPGGFAAPRKYDIHTGIDLYCNPDDEVFAIECGEVVGIIDFTGTNAESSWWNDTRAVMIEGASGVFVYGEIKEREGLKIGDNIEAGDYIGNVLTVLKEDKGKPMTMLHLELYEHKFRETLIWKLREEKPKPLIDPTKILIEIHKGH